MRIKLALRPGHSEVRVPINYQYPLSAAIYKVLQQAAPEYASFLHDRGYRAASGRLMKLFTFSKLWNSNIRRQGETLCSSRGVWLLHIGSPMLDEFVQNFVLGLFESSEIAIGWRGLHAAFRVEQVETLPLPEFRQRTRCKCLSPITASTGVERQNRLQIHYYRPGEPELSEALRRNLLQKYRILHQRAPADSALRFYFEPGDTPRGKLIRLKEGTAEETRVRCFESYFTLEGSSELMQTAWECGLGERGSQGFGMIDVV